MTFPEKEYIGRGARLWTWQVDWSRAMQDRSWKHLWAVMDCVRDSEDEHGMDVGSQKVTLKANTENVENKDQ